MNMAARIRSQRALQSAITEFDLFNRNKPNSTPVQRAAAIAHAIIVKRPFKDGNKRTAETVASHILESYNCRPLVIYNWRYAEYNLVTVKRAHTLVANGGVSRDLLADLYADILAFPGCVLLFTLR